MCKYTIIMITAKYFISFKINHFNLFYMHLNKCLFLLILNYIFKQIEFFSYTFTGRYITLQPSLACRVIYRLLLYRDSRVIPQWISCNYRPRYMDCSIKRDSVCEKITNNFLKGLSYKLFGIEAVATEQHKSVTVTRVVGSIPIRGN